MYFHGKTVETPRHLCEGLLEKPMNLWIDNDGCPKVLRDLILRVSQNRKVMTFVVANSAFHLPINPFVKQILVAQGMDEADDYIADHVEKGDLVLSSDVPLSARVVANGGLVLNFRGEVLDNRNIGERLATRNLLQELRGGAGGSTGGIHGGPAPFGDQDKKRFADAVDRMVTMGLKK